MYSVKIIADSISPSGCRITTLVATFPRFILAEVNTHGLLAKNSASSRAIPVKKRIQAVLASPFIPDEFCENQRGMSAGASLVGWKNTLARAIWRFGSLASALTSSLLERLNVHKQWASRPMEPYLWHEVVITATEWENFFNLRISAAAQPEFKKIAEMIKGAIEKSTPQKLFVGEWHLPFATGVLGNTDTLREISSARCARVSYLTQEGKSDPVADIALHNKLLEAGHMSPFDHPAQCCGGNDVYGRFRGWKPYRKFIPGEADIHTYRKQNAGV